MPRPCPSCCECPERIVVRVRSYCNPFGAGALVEGATVTARDRAGIQADVTGTTDANGLVELAPAAPGTFDVAVTVGTCTEIYEVVTTADCGAALDVAPCCGTVCVGPYDYDTGLSVSGATVDWVPFFGSGPAYTPIGLDGGGAACWDYADHVGELFRIQASGYYTAVDFACECDCQGQQDYPVAMYSTATYVAGRAVSGFAQECLNTRTCVTRKTLRNPAIFRRRMFVDFAGTPTFGGNSTGIAVDLVSELNGLTWEGWAEPGGSAIKRTTVTVINSTTFEVISSETTDEPYEFPAALVMIFQGNAGGSFGDFPISGLDWTNHISRDPRVPAPSGGSSIPPGYGFGTTIQDSGNTRTITTVSLVEIGYCFSSDTPAFATGVFPFSVSNSRAMRCPGLTEEDVCLPTAPFGFYGMQAPVNVAGTFWCGGICSDGYVTTRPTATYAVYE